METHRFRADLGLLLGVALFSLFLQGCQSHSCRTPKMPELDSTSGRPAVAPAIAASPKKSDSASETEEPPRVRVYKADGSRQCSRGGGLSLEMMERELAGIPVHSKEKRADGLMHIQVCGSPTGQINLYEIDQSNLKQAEERGFRRWEGEP